MGKIKSPQSVKNAVLGRIVALVKVAHNAFNAPAMAELTTTYRTTRQIDEAYAAADLAQQQAERDYHRGAINLDAYWASVATAQQTFRHLDQEQRILDVLRY